MPSDGESGTTDEFHLFRPPGPVEIAAARALRIQDRPIPIPIEVLSCIFCHWRDIWLTHIVHGMRGTIYCDLKSLKAPFVLQAVCRRWRDIARSTPKLWADLFISCGASNRRLNYRLDITIKRAGDVPLTVYIRDIHAGIYGKRWFQDMVKILNPTVIRWARLTMSFVHTSDVDEFLQVWPLNGVRLQQITFYGSIDGTPANTLPDSFPPSSAPIRIIHLRNIVWWQSRIFADLREIAIGPSHGNLLTQDAIVALLCGTPNIQRLKLLAFEHRDIPRARQGLPEGFRLEHLHSLAASPVVLRTTLVRFDSPDILPALANVSIHFDAQDDAQDDDEDYDIVRLEDDLRGVGMFLQRHFTTALKLRGLYDRYSPDVVTRLVFVPMNSSRIETVHFADCVGHTTEFIVGALGKVAYTPPGISSNQLRGHRTSQTRGGPTGGSVFLFPHLMTVRLTRCLDVDGFVIANALMAGRPHPLHQLELRNSDIDLDQYNRVLALLRH